MTRFIFIVAILVFALCGFVAPATAQVNVTQEHNNPSRDGLYIDPAFTPSAGAGLTRDLNFNGTISGERLRPAALYRRRCKWSDDHCGDRVE
jgi:hypothetical protein